MARTIPKSSASTAVLSTGTIKQFIPIDHGSLVGASMGSNNTISGINYATGADGAWKGNLPLLEGRTEGDVYFQAIVTAPSSGDVGNESIWDFSYAFLVSGESLGSPTTVRYTLDMESVYFDTVYTWNFTIPEASVPDSYDAIFFILQRTGTDAGDTFSSTVYLHSAYLVYTGEGL